MSPATPFGDRLAAAVATRSSQIVLGLDPDPAHLWPVADSAPSGTPHKRATLAVVEHCKAVIDAVGDAVVAIKPQLACFERLGVHGRAALGSIVEYAQEQGLLVLADAKRGDIDVSALAYAQALLGSTPSPFGEIEGLGADAMTASAYMGADTLAPLLQISRPRGAGVFVLVRTSNPGAVDIEDSELAAGGTVWERVASIVDSIGEPGPQSGLSDVGAVVGATAPEHVARMRELMPATPFLLPGIGAQGGRVEDLAAAFSPGRAAGLITASRSIVRAHEAEGARSDPGSAARAEAERLRESAWCLA